MSDETIKTEETPEIPATPGPVPTAENSLHPNKGGNRGGVGMPGKYVPTEAEIAEQKRIAAELED